uniref:docking protein 2 n=1 Tax=Lonchura striata TaxID=40157 RepID=UPI0012938FB4|nr:docking protein 2 [Lonchura striata domestica]
MEEAVVKQGALYLQLQQTFGKKWRRFWAVLYRESRLGAARLELRAGAERARGPEAGRRLVRLRDCVHVAAEGLPEPPGDATAEHVYDEPEALARLRLYAEPREVQGEAWRLQAAPEEPPGPGRPYDARRDDYAVPGPLRGAGRLGRGDYDNVALRAAARREPQ